MMLKVGFNKHYLVIVAVLLCCFTVKSQTAPDFAELTVPNGTYNAFYSTTITTTDAENNNRAITITGTLPGGVLFTDLNNGSAQIEGTPTEVGTFNFTLTVEDLVDATQNTHSYSLTIDKANPVITWVTPASITYGTALSSTQLNATADVVGTFVYTPDNGTQLNAGPDQTLTVSFTPTDAAHYTTAGSSVLLTVLKATPTVSWVEPSPITYGTALGSTQLTATASVAGTFTYTPASGTVLNAGVSQLLTVSFSPTDLSNYETVPSTTVHITVDKALPTITWTTPSAITYGTALSSVQLNATSTTPGTFTYSPASGTVLNAGNGQSLTASFAPTDAANYSSVPSTSVNIDVLKADPVLTWSTPGAITYPTPLSSTQLNATSSTPGTFTYTPASGTVLNAGPGQTLSASFTPSNTTNFNTGTITAQITVNKATPTVSWSAPAAIVYGTTLSATQLNATASVPGTFTYTPSAGATLSAGSQTLSVDFVPTSSNYNSVNGTTVSLTVTKATPTVTWNAPVAITYGTPLSATQQNATSSVPGNFFYSPASGTILNAGTDQLMITNFTPTDAANYNSVNGTSTVITVNKATPVITWTNPAAIPQGTPLSATQLNASSSVAGSFVYTPPAGTVLSAGANQVLTADFTPSNTTNYNSVNGTTVLINVNNKINPTITWNTPAAINYGTALSATQLNATASVAGSFSYTPASGTILNAGTQTLNVTFTPTDGATYNEASASVQIVVNKVTPVINWSTPAAITYGTALSATQLNATTSVAGTFTYTPSAGTVLNAGTPTLSVNFTPTDGANYNSVTGTTVNLTVNKANPVISWTNPAAITYGTALSSAQQNATANVAGSFVYSPVSGTILNAGANQNISVNFTPTDAVNYNTVNGTSVQITVNKATPTISWATPASITYGTALSATQLNASASVAGTLVYTPASGTVLNAGTQTLSVNFTPSNTSNYNSVNGTTVQIVVNKATPTITWTTPSAIVYGTTLSAAQLNATASVAGSFTYTPATGTQLNAGTQTLSANFTPTDAANFNSVNGTTVQLVVNKATPTITWSNPAAITYGTTLSGTQLNATASTPGTFTYTPAAGTLLNAGTQTLTANFTPSNTTNYNSVNGTAVQIVVNKATPVISWTTPASITYGTALSSTQLNASANVAGTLVYTPASGTILNAGTQTLSVDFTPTVTANYNSVSGTTVQVVVNKATPTVTWPAPSSISLGTALGATQLNATASTTGTFTYSPPSGTQLGLGTHTLSVNFTPSNTSNFNSVNGTTVQITVNNKVSPTITWPAPAAITYGTAISNTQLNATANIPGSFTYSPASGAILNAGVQTLSLNFVPDDAANYNTINNFTTSITVNKATSTVTWSNPANITYGTPLSATQLNATASVPGTFTYSPAAGTLLNAGDNQNLQVSFTPTSSNYTTVPNTTVSISVNKATPVITWAAPAAITYGTALSSTQLNASSSAPGTFAYNPAAGTLLSAGANQSLNVLFTPTNAGNYNSATGAISIDVNKAPLSVKANNDSRTYGASNPALTTSITGFVNGETQTVIDTPPVATTTATVLSPVGNYPLTASGGVDDNYSFSYTSGLLTITKAVLNANPDDKSKLYGDDNPVFTMTYSGFLNGETEAVIDVRPTVSTTAVKLSPAGTYPISATGGADNNYNFSYTSGTLTVIANNPPVLKNFQVSVNEDTRFDFTYDQFYQNIVDDPGNKIAFIKIISLPVNGTLSWKGNRVSVGDEITSANNTFENFTYQPNTDYNGTDSFNWNSSDGIFLSANPASVTIRVIAVNDPPVLSNIESESIKYSLGDKGVPITQKLTVNDVDNNFMHSAKITIAENYSSGDNLAASPTMSTKIVAAFNTATGELTLKGKDTKSNYETALSGIVFSSPVNGSATISNKILTISVNDSTANSNIVSRVIEITEVFPELDIVNAFTPNGDGVNDQWDILNLDLYSKIKISIVNLEGINVFSCASPDCKWDGKLNGKELPSGNYFYTIDLNDGKRKYQGTVTILK
ncbi:MAG: hypothetical protein DI538_07605 [Azospira oryzae]|nr:MAG: hypothetical protein DI538_07605 [Azospira oryzae]